MRLVAGVALAAALASCSAAMPLADYAEAVETLGRDYEAETTALQRALEEELQSEIASRQRVLDRGDEAAVAAFATEVVELTATRTAGFFAGVGDALTRHRDALAALEPPSQVRDRHDEFVAAADGALAGIPALLAGLGTTQSFDEIDAAVNGSGFTDGLPRLAAGCEALEQQLIDAGETVNLRCPA